MTELSSFREGQRVELQNGLVGTVRFVGTTHFAAGAWIGLELDGPDGKNDGSVQGERYFDVKAGHGMFVRPAMVTTVVQSKARPTSTAASSKSSGRDSSAPSPTPTPKARPSAVRSSNASPTKGSLSTVKRASSSLRSTSTPAVKPGTRTSMAPPPRPRQSVTTVAAKRQSLTSTTANRQSLTSTTANSRPAPAAKPRSSVQPRQTFKTPASLFGKRSSIASAEVDSSSGRSTPDSRKPNGTSPPTNGTKSPIAQRSPPGPAKSASTLRSAPAKEVEDLKAKLRVMERKRLEDRDKLKALDKIQQDKDKFETIIQKLQTKLQPQTLELQELRKKAKDIEGKLESAENTHAEHEIALEMATLDREMAEETAEVLRGELDALKLRMEETELEIAILREENEELSKDLSPEERSSQGWLQLERQNERLRAALIKLRDISQDQEETLTDEIRSLEAEVKELGDIKEQYEATKQRLEASEAAVEDLRSQLDAAMGDVEMLEELTERNMTLTEQINEMQAAIDDLESLKEVNDELEMHHVETERQMQDEIDFKESALNEKIRQLAQQEDAMAEHEYTISRFRGLVTSLQSDLEEVKSSQQMTDAEAEELSSRSKAMMDLNMKLQMSASKAQAKQIDLEMRKLEASEALEHFAIVQLFLPDTYTLANSVLTLLRFKRISFKSQLLLGFVKEDEEIEACDAAEKLVWLSAMCDRFTAYISSCSVERFEKFDSVLFELEPVERALNGWIESVRVGDFKAKVCADALQRTMAVISHLAEIHIQESIESFAHQSFASAQSIHAALEEGAAAISICRDMVTKLEGDEVPHLIGVVDNALSQCRSAKVIASKIVRGVDQMLTRSLALSPTSASTFEQCQAETAQLSLYTRAMAQEVANLEEREYSQVVSAMCRAAGSVFGFSESDPFICFSNKLRILITTLSDLASLSSDLEATVEFERAKAPWVLRAQELKFSKVVAPDLEEEIRRLKEDVVERVTQIRLKDKTLEESNVKIELLEARTRDAAKKTERITVLERELADLTSREKKLAATVESQISELSALEADRNKWRKMAETRASVAQPVQVVTDKRELEQKTREIESLQEAVRYFRNRSSIEPSSLDWLAPLPAPARELPLEAESKSCLQSLIQMVEAAEFCELKPPGWRRTRETPRYKHLVQAEHYETWSSWQDDVQRKAIFPVIMGVDIPY